MSAKPLPMLIHSSVTVFFFALFLAIMLDEKIKRM